MTPVHFPEENTVYGPPPGFAESQVASVPAYQGTIQQGSLEGSTMVVVAWKPTLQEVEDIRRGLPIYLAVMGGLPPHILGTTFYDVTHPQ